MKEKETTNNKKLCTNTHHHGISGVQVHKEDPSWSAGDKKPYTEGGVSTGTHHWGSKDNGQSLTNSE